MTPDPHRHRTQPDAGAPIDRRDFLRLGAAGLALAGLDGCTRMPPEHILPYVDNRPELTPGVAQYYATAMCIDGYATGLVVESHVGRPTKIEGNPDHPASLGASGPMEQASILHLYDPDRATRARIGRAPAEWNAVAATLAPNALGQHLGARGRGLHLLIEPTSSPLEAEWLARVAERYPDARVHMYAPLAPDPAASPFVQHYDIGRADVIVAVDADVLATGPFHLRYARQFADGRRLARPGDPMNRLYAIESGLTPTGAAADHRFPVRPREIVGLLRGLLASVTGRAGEGRGAEPSWLAAIARDLTSHAGRGVVIVGAERSAEERAVGDAINAAIGATGQTTWHTRSPLLDPRIALAPLGDLTDALGAREVDTLIIVGGNPVYATPAAMDLSGLLERVPTVGYVGSYENETAHAARWFVPMSHYLESWGDARAYDGTLSIVQPLITPRARSIVPVELYAILAGAPPGDARAYELLRADWARRAGASSDAEDAWSEALQRGVVRDTAFPRVAAPATAVPSAAPDVRAEAGASSAIDVVYTADSRVHDGTFANNAWLQELPAPMTQLAWGNAGLISPATARALGVATGDVVSLTSGDRRMSIPIMTVPGHADGSMSVHFGYGRAGEESVAKGIGANAFQLWPAPGVRVEAGVGVARTGATEALTIAQTEPVMEPARPVRSATLEEYRASPTSVGQRPGRVLSLYPEPAPPVGLHGPNQWAMTIDLGTCIGCGACVVACQAENNIPVVGPEEVRRGRVMHWLRIDRYFAEREAEVDVLLQPMLCQHCEKAPCEYVCPVEATVHSPDGLNEMVYNRCVGTRFCSNNCPYKVRRFNWFDYNRALPESEVAVKNPNVTVRERGVMEKCTFCVQRIREAEISAGRAGRTLRGSEVRTACQQSCPTNAIVFGSLTEPDSEMVRRREQPRSYAALHELGTEPRVRYLARVRNPNPDAASER